MEDEELPSEQRRKDGSSLAWRIADADAQMQKQPTIIRQSSGASGAR